VRNDPQAAKTARIGRAEVRDTARVMAERAALRRAMCNVPASAPAA
jgi:hypothetical protein